jgi:hypothetical protein
MEPLKVGHERLQMRVRMLMVPTVVRRHVREQPADIGVRWSSRGWTSKAWIKLVCRCPELECERPV